MSVRQPLSFLVLSVLLLAPPAAEAQDGRSRGGSSQAASQGSDGAQIFIEAFQAIRNYSFMSVEDSTLWDMAIDGLVEGLGDPYAAVFTPSEVAEFEEETTGNYAGIGVQITELNQAVTITAVFRGTPAEESGLQVGDVIVGVDGENADGWTTGAASRRIRGEPLTSVEVQVRRDGVDQPIHHTITRAQVHISSVTAARLFDDVGYIALGRVARNSAVEVDSALVMLGDTRGIILDLRENPGGLLDESLFLADLFLPPGKKLAGVRSRSPGAPEPVEESWDARQPARLDGKPIVILVDRFTASAAEIVAGALQDHDRALVLGERTFGKGVVQTVLPLPGGRQIRLTTGEWFTPMGRGLHRARDREGRPVEGEGDARITVQSQGGRTLQAGGGVFPDLAVAADTLTLVEREFLTQSAGVQYPLGARIQELTFGAAQTIRAGEGGAELDDGMVARILAELKEAGVEDSVADRPEVAAYLRIRMAEVLQRRLGDDGKATEIRAGRDAVLSEAIRMLQGVQTQPELFREADRVRTALLRR